MSMAEVFNVVIFSEIPSIVTYWGVYVCCISNLILFLLDWIKWITWSEMVSKF